MIFPRKNHYQQKYRTVYRLKVDKLMRSLSTASFQKNEVQTTRDLNFMPLATLLITVLTAAP